MLNEESDFPVIKDIKRDLGERRPGVWIPAAEDNTWTPTPGERIQDARRGKLNTSPARIAETGAVIPSRGVYVPETPTPDRPDNYGFLLECDGTRRIIGPTGQYEPEQPVEGEEAQQADISKARITRLEAVRLLSSIVDCEWADTWGEDGDLQEILDLADSCVEDARIEEEAVQRHRLTHEAGALRLVAELVSAT